MWFIFFMGAFSIALLVWFVWELIELNRIMDARFERRMKELDQKGRMNAEKQ